MTEWRVDESFGPVPLWLLRMKVSDRAIRLYALLSALRDYGTDMATIGRKRLAKELGCSEDSLDRAKAELEKVSAITVDRPERSDGAIPTNVYTIHRTNPASRTGAVTPIAAPERGGDSRTGAGSSTEGSSSRRSSTSTAGKSPQSVDGRRVTADEHAMCDSVLEAFNAAAGKRFAGKDWRRAIIMRLRDHPEVTLDRHLEIIRTEFEQPWWKGDPTPSVIYGNSKVFDSALNGVRRGKDNAGDGPDPFAAYG